MDDWAVLVNLRIALFSDSDIGEQQARQRVTAVKAQAFQVGSFNEVLVKLITVDEQATVVPGLKSTKQLAVAFLP